MAFQLPSMSRNKIFGIGAAVVLGVLGLFAVGSLFENVDADEIVVIQNPLSGHLAWYTDPGPKWQGFGKVTTYKKRSIYTFESKIRFNDGAHAMLKGSIQYELPLSPRLLTAIHTRFGTQEAVEIQLVQTVVDKSIYMSGPLMSSKESYAEKRNDLIYYVEDQVAGGVYKTSQSEVQVPDPLTGAIKTVTVVNIRRGTNGLPLRQEVAVLSGFGVKPFNFSITSLDYDDTVEKQIGAQQTATAAVQTAMANARKAEQDAVTAEKKGQALAAEAKWAQEAVKATAVTAAEKDREVARLRAEAAAFTKQEQILLGEGEGTRRRLVMQADGALAQRLATYERVNKAYAEAIRGYQGAWVPNIMMGGQDGRPYNAAQSLMELFSVRTARDLSVDVGAPPKK